MVKCIKIIKEGFVKTFGEEPLLVRAPGRINIIGEHTDYNEGFVLPAAIDKAVYLGISLRSDNEIHLCTENLGEKYFTRTEEVRPLAHGSWPNYILGVYAQFKKLGKDLPGFNAMLYSDLPIGAGLSSSAALEAAVTMGLNELLETRLPPISMIRMAQLAEQEYAGVMCGVMDMFASMMGKKEYAIKLDCRSLAYEYIPLSLQGYQILLLNTNVKHSLASSAYNTRRNECKQAADWVNEGVGGIMSLRDVTQDMLLKYVRPKDITIYRRSCFVVQEQKRLEQACADLKKGNLKSLGKKMNQTHTGLSTLFEVSCRELDFIAQCLADNDAVLGTRMMGGGFGGCTISIIKQSAVETTIAELDQQYEECMGTSIIPYLASVEDGTTILRETN